MTKKKILLYPTLGPLACVFKLFNRYISFIFSENTLYSDSRGVEHGRDNKMFFFILRIEGRPF